MNKLDAIAVNVETFTGNVQPLLHEIRHALSRLADGQPGTVIDLRSLPLAPGEEQQLEAQLGRGEISAELDARGITTIIETSFAGVWLVTHCNEAEEVESKFIEVTRCPDILKTQIDDMEAGLQRLDQHLTDAEQNGNGQT